MNVIRMKPYYKNIFIYILENAAGDACVTGDTTDDNWLHNRLQLVTNR